MLQNKIVIFAISVTHCWEGQGPNKSTYILFSYQIKNIQMRLHLTSFAIFFE